MDNVVTTSPTALTSGIGNVYKVIDSMDDLLKMCQVLVKSGLLPNQIKSVEAAAVIVLQAREIGIGPMTAFRGIHVIQGNPTIAPWLMLALINRSNLLEDITIVDNGEACQVTLKRVGRQPHTESFSMEDAKLMVTFEGQGENRKTIPLAQKYNWRQMPKVMRKWRAISACARIVFPDVLAGLYIPEELGSEDVVTEDGYIIEGSATPTPEPKNSVPPPVPPNGGQPAQGASANLAAVEEFTEGILTYKMDGTVKLVKVSIGDKPTVWMPAENQITLAYKGVKLPLTEATKKLFASLFNHPKEMENHLRKHFEGAVLSTLTWEELMALWEWKKNGKKDSRWYDKAKDEKESSIHDQENAVRKEYYGDAYTSEEEDSFIAEASRLADPLCLKKVEERYSRKVRDDVTTFTSLAILLLSGDVIFDTPEFWETCDAAFQTQATVS